MVVVPPTATSPTLFLKYIYVLHLYFFKLEVQLCAQRLGWTWPFAVAASSWWSLSRVVVCDPIYTARNSLPQIVRNPLRLARVRRTRPLTIYFPLAIHPILLELNLFAGAAAACVDTTTCCATNFRTEFHLDLSLTRGHDSTCADVLSSGAIRQRLVASTLASSSRRDVATQGFFLKT